LPVLGVSSAHAVSPADKCESSELKTSGKYGFCQLKAEAKAVKAGGSPDFSKCDATFADKFGKADMNGMGQCPSSASQAAIQAFVTQCTDDVATMLAGGSLPTCQPPPLQTGQQNVFGTGSDGDLQKGASRSYTDNGDGTITDNTTGLMWEKKDLSGSGIHDYTNMYTWGDTFPSFTMDGTMVSTFLTNLNAGGGFAGHTDWRIPNVNELQSIANYSVVAALPVDPVFFSLCAVNCMVASCSCTFPTPHWSSSTYRGGDQAWFVDFTDGSVGKDSKSSLHAVRAVRNAP